MFDSTDGLPGPVMTNRFGKARTHQAEIGARARRPFLVQRLAVASPYIDLRDRPRHGVKPGRQHQRIDFVLLAGDAHGIFSDLLEGLNLMSTSLTLGRLNAAK